jgi:hypothetical protein
MMVVLAALLPSTTASAALLPISFNPDMHQGFLLDPNLHTTVGYLTQFQIGSAAALSNDFELQSPTLQTLDVAGVLSLIQWAGGPIAPLTVTAYLSQKNMVAVSNYLSTHSTRPTMKFGFTVLAWDSTARSYYTAFAPSTSPIATRAEVSNGHVQITMSTTPVILNYTVKVYPMTFEASAPTLLATLKSTNRATLPPLPRLWGPNLLGL